MSSENTTIDATRQVRSWNSLYPVGTGVFLTKDSGEVVQTKTRSQAWILGGHTAVVMVDGIAGAYLLDRVTAK